MAGTRAVRVDAGKDSAWFYEAGSSTCPARGGHPDVNMAEFRRHRYSHREAHLSVGLAVAAMPMYALLTFLRARAACAGSVAPTGLVGASAYRPRGVVGGLHHQRCGGFGGLMRQAGQDTGIGVGSQHNAGVSEHGLYGLEFIARRQRQTRRAMPQIMQPDRRQIGPRHQPAKRMRHVARAQRIPLRVGEQESCRRTTVDDAALPGGAQAPEFRGHDVVQGDRADTVQVLGGQITVRPLWSCT